LQIKLFFPRVKNTKIIKLLNRIKISFLLLRFLHLNGSADRAEARSGEISTQRTLNSEASA
jgi:hypothetical protein